MDGYMVGSKACMAPPNLGCEKVWSISMAGVRRSSGSFAVRATMSGTVLCDAWWGLCRSITLGGRFVGELHYLYWFMRLGVIEGEVCGPPSKEVRGDECEEGDQLSNG